MFAFIATLLVGSIGTAGAQVNYTVYDGTGTSTYVPVEGLYTDSRLKCEYVIPADHLTAINGSTISKLTYYLTSSATAAWTCNFQVFVKEVASSTISSFSGMEDATLVYEGTLDATSSTMEVVFSTPYTYNGGNLLIGFYNTNTGNYKSATFAGQTITGASVQGHNNNFSSITAAQKNFIPKTTFTVDELHGCLTPTNLAVSDVATYGATVTWTPGNTETDWVVKFNDDEYPVSGTPSYTVTGLTPNTSYVASVKAVCGGTEESEYTTPGVLFTTLPTCPAPTAVTFSNITTTSVDVAWTENGPANAWTIEANGTEYAADSNPFTLNGLNPSTNYTVKVKANCSEEDESDWSATATFATACGAIALTETTPYSENFDSYTATSQNSANGVIPICWGTISNGTNANTLPRVCTSYVPISGSKGLNFRSGGTTYQNCGTINIAYLPEITNPQGAVVAFAYKMENTSNGTLSVGYVTDLNDVTSFVSAVSVTSSTSAANSEVIIPTTIPAGARIAFQWEETSTSYYDCGIDNLVVSMAPACAKPTAVTVSNITETTAEISWTEQGTTNEWTIMLDSTEISATTNPFTLTNLTAATNYTVKVRSICSEEDESDWSNEVSFRTECGTVALPFYESFEDGEFGCWTTEATSTSYNWNVSNGSITDYTSLSPADGSYVAYMNSHTRDKSAKLISPVLNLAGVNAPELSFQYLNHAWGGDQNILKVYYRTDATAAWTLLDTFAVDVTAWTEEVISLPNATATYQIAFEAVIDYGYNIVLDAISIIGVSCPAPTNVVVANETENSAEVSWTAGGEETAWNLRYRTAPETVVAYDFENDLQGWSTLNTDGDTLVFVHSSENISGYLYDSLGHNGSNGFAVSNSFIDDMGEVNVNQYFVVDSSYTANETTSFVFYYDYGNDNFPDYFEAGVFTQDPTDATNFTSLWNSSSRGAANAANANVRHTERTRYENWREVAIDLSEFAGQQVWIAFHHQDYDNYELWIDDISIVETAEWTVVNGVTNPYTITDLTANTTYEVQVQAACSDDETSNWTASVEFTTLGETPVVDTCEVPANIAVEHNVVTWESEAENFNLMYVVANDTTTVEVADNTYTFEGLEDGTVVTVMVQAICDEDNTSDWSEATEFTFEGVGINNYGLNANVYPNPTRDVVNVECTVLGANLSVYDMFGKVVMNTTIQSERTELNLSNVAPGVYMIRIANNNAITTVKVVKK